MLNGNHIVFIAFFAQRGQVIQQFGFEIRNIAFINFKNGVSGHVMFGAVGQHSVSRRRLPPEKRRFIETNQGAVPVRSHVQVFYTQIVVKIVHAPCNAVHIVLHGHFRLKFIFFKKFQRLQRCCKHLFFGQFIKIEIHRCNFDPSFLNPFFQSPDLFGRATFQKFIHCPGCFASPAEFCGIRIIVGGIAVIQCIVDVSQVFGQDFGL